MNTYKLSVLPSWYESWWAYLIYASIFGGLLLTGWRYYRYRQERQMIKMANEMSIRKEKDLYKNKIQFFTEIAHEIRTPLSLIGSPLEAIDEIGVRDERVERYLKIIRMNANRLLDLTTHLLDFQKIDGNQPSLNFENVDVTALVQKIFSRFELTMSLKNKTVTASLPDKSILATIDPEAITKIISNLFNNALKYSDSAIEIALTADAGKFTLAVASDGARIEGEHRLRIFEPFYQIDPETSHAGGVGIGLPLSSSLAKLHSGSLTLADTSTLANTFVLEIPLHQENVEVDNDSNPVMAEFVMEEDNAVSTADRAYSMLFVEDNADMRDFLYDQLSRSFNIETAVNGVEALKLLAERRFDIVVTDIMMPAMDGYELCSRIKENVDSSNIPVVFLTAKNDLDSKLKALKCGGEAYIEKPFSIKYFRQQIMSLLDNRQHERKAFLKKPFFTIDSMKLNKADEEFMNKVVKIVTDNIADENFSELQAAHARFANCFLSCCDFSGSLFTDTVFEGCDFANSYFDSAGFTRCTFKNCKLTGASFMEANLEHVALEDCTLDFGAFNRCRFWAVSATRCDFSGADMAEMELHYVTLDDDRFIGTSFFRTPLLGLDFSTCQLEGVALSDTMAEIYGTKMNVYQAAALARRLGVIVAE